MATNETLTIVVSAKDAASSVLKGVATSASTSMAGVANAAGKADAATSKLAANTTGAFGKMTAGAQTYATQIRATSMGLAAFGAVGIMALKQVVDAAAEAESASVKLAVAIKNSGQAISQANLTQLADDLMKVTTYDDEAIKSMMAFLAAGKMNEDQIKRLTPALLDLAEFMGKDLDGAAKAVAYAMETGNVTAFKRLKIAVDETKFALDPFGALLDAIESKAGGMAEAAGKTLAGQLLIAKNQVGELKEAIGGGLAPALQMVTPIIVWTAEQLTAIASTRAGKVLTAIGAAGIIAAAGLGAVGLALPPLIVGWNLLTGAQARAAAAATAAAAANATAGTAAAAGGASAYAATASWTALATAQGAAATTAAGAGAAVGAGGVAAAAGAGGLLARGGIIGAGARFVAGRGALGAAGPIGAVAAIGAAGLGYAWNRKTRRAEAEQKRLEESGPAPGHAAWWARVRGHAAPGATPATQAAAPAEDLAPAIADNLAPELAGEIKDGLATDIAAEMAPDIADYWAARTAARSSLRQGAVPRWDQMSYGMRDAWTKDFSPEQREQLKQRGGPATQAVLPEQVAAGAFLYPELAGARETFEAGRKPRRMRLPADHVEPGVMSSRYRQGADGKIYIEIAIDAASQPAPGVLDDSTTNYLDDLAYTQ